MDRNLKKFAERLGNREWRLAHLYQIRDSEGHIVPFIPRAEQWGYFRGRHSRNMVPKARKLGISTGIVIDYLDACIWTPQGIHAAHIDLTQDHAEGKIEIARLAWDEGPKHPVPEIAELWRWIHLFRPLVKRNASMMEWKHGSKQEAGVSFVGGTPQRLHWSEAGPLSVQDPKKAARIRRQSLNAVPTSGIIDVETTMEGGTYGEAYSLFKLALEHKGDLTAEDWKFWFFAWYQHPDYILDSGPSWVPTADTIAYFQELERQESVTLPRNRWAWYERRAKLQGPDMFSQFPSTPAECIRSAIAGQIYPEITNARQRGRVTRLAIEPGVPIVTCWDLGTADAAAAWLVQILPTQILFHRHYEATGTGATETAQQIRNWEIEIGRRIDVNLFPHDVDTRDRGSGLSYRKQLETAGVPPLTIRKVERTQNIYTGIGEVRRLLPKAYFDLSTDTPRKSETGADLPSGVGCLENYRRKLEGGREVPVHDHTSHTADAARCLAEGMAQGLHIPHADIPTHLATPLQVKKLL
jgi:hypothetical protein